MTVPQVACEIMGVAELISCRYGLFVNDLVFRRGHAESKLRLRLEHL